MALCTLQTASIAALTFCCWEILITLQDEVDTVWPRKRTMIKFLYFFTRYFALAIQICNVIISRVLAVRYPVPTETCRLWLSYQALAVYFLLGAVDLILMIRVYAFYNRRKWIVLLFLFLMIFRISLSTAGAIMTVPDQTFNDSCLNEYIPTTIMYFFIMGEIILQAIILGLTLFKHVVAVRDGWARTPLVSLLCRDGATTFTVIVGVLIGTIIYARLEFMHDSAHAVFPAFISVLSCLGCRLIISMLKLVVVTNTAANDEEIQDMESLQFSTIIRLSWSRSPSEAGTPYISSP